MTGEEAKQLAGFLKAAFPSMTPEQVEVYESSLLFEDAAFASRAILDGIREWKHAPRYAEIVERIKLERRRATPREPEVDHFAKPTPFWVKRWVVARFVADPPDLRVFQEQYPFPEAEKPAEGWMPEDAWVEEAKLLTVEQVRRAINPALRTP